MRAFIIALLCGTAYSIDCAELRTVFQQSSCCGGDGDTCLRAIPDCADVSNGEVCFNGSAVEVKGLSNYLGFEPDHLELRKSLIPSQDAVFDIGSSTYKILDFYEDQTQRL